MQQREKTVYFPGLNGLRALAALSVLWGHTFQDTFGIWKTSAGNILPSHNFFSIDGVTLFFVISGFLITYLLLKELDKTNTINIPKFYMRRILRIWPIYYGYIIACIAILAILPTLLGGGNTLINSTLYYYLFFAANIPFCWAGGLWPIVHYWSIGVEEQFYLFWPWLARIGKKRILPIAVAVLIIWLACKWGSYAFLGKTFVYRFFGVTRFHCMMWGAIGAILLHQQNKRFITLFTNKWITSLAWVLFLTSGLYSHLMPSPCQAEYIAFLALILIMSQVATKPFIINLENRVCDFIGKISYGIYVIHPMLIYLLSLAWNKMQVALPDGVQITLIYTFVTAITIFVAWLSYTFYEKRFLRIKTRFAVVQSKSSQNG